MRKTAALVACGDSLSQTLLLNLHPYDKRVNLDLPAWEKSKAGLGILGSPTLATGLNDRYTRQTRAAFFFRENDGFIQWLLFASGMELVNDDNAPDPMASFKSRKKSVKPVTFSEGRAVWRDLPVLIPTRAEKAAGAAVLDWALGLHDQNEIESMTFYQPVLLAGMASGESGGEAKNARWRSERIEIPLSVKKDYDKHSLLEQLISGSEKLYDSLSEIAKNMLTQSLPTKERKETAARARELFNSGGFSASYFSILEKLLPYLMDCLRKNRLGEAEVYWAKGIRKAAEEMWKQLKISMGFSSRSLGAQAMFEPQFKKKIKQFCTDQKLEEGVSD